MQAGSPGKGGKGIGSTNLDLMRRWKWRILLALSGFYSFFYFGRINWGIIAPYINRNLHVSELQIGIGAGTMYAVYALSAFFQGHLSDEYGHRLWCALGAVGTTVFNVLASFAQSFVGLLVPLSLNGAVQAMAYGPGNGLLAQWWPKREHGLAMGFFLAAADFSSIVAWALVSLIALHIGWRWALRLPFLLTLLAAVAFWILTRDRPDQVGLPGPGGASKPPQESWRKVYGRLLGDRHFLVACLSGATASTARFGLYTWIPLYWAETSGLQMLAVTLATLWLPIGMLLGPITSGWISDSLLGGRRWPIVAGSLGLAALAMGFIAWFPIRTVGVGISIVLLMAVGFLIMGGMGLIYSLGVDAAGRLEAGTGGGVVDSFNYLGAALQGAVLGAILQTTGSWSDVFWFLALVLLAGAVSIVWAKDPPPAEEKE